VSSELLSHSKAVRGTRRTITIDLQSKCTGDSEVLTAGLMQSCDIALNIIPLPYETHRLLYAPDACVLKAGLCKVRFQNGEKRLLNSPCLSVRLSAWNNSAPTGRILRKLIFESGRQKSNFVGNPIIDIFS
jgi:hypothetical protein